MSRHDFGNEVNVRVDRRTFIKGCTMAAAALGLSETMVPKLVAAGPLGPAAPGSLAAFSGMHRLYGEPAPGIAPGPRPPDPRYHFT